MSKVARKCCNKSENRYTKRTSESLFNKSQKLTHTQALLFGFLRFYSAKLTGVRVRLQLCRYHHNIPKLERALIRREQHVKY